MNRSLAFGVAAISMLALAACGNDRPAKPRHDDPRPATSGQVSGVVEPPAPCARRGIHRGRDYVIAKEATRSLPGLASLSVDGGCIVVGLVVGTPVPDELGRVNQDDLRIWRARWPRSVLMATMKEIARDRAWFDQRGIELQSVGVSELDNRVELSVSASSNKQLEGIEHVVHERYGEHVQVDAKVRSVATALQAWDRSEISSDGRRVTVSWTGGSGDCGGFDHADVEEYDRRIVVSVYVRHQNVGACPLVGYPGSATVTLEQPVDDRKIVDATEPAETRDTGRYNALLARGTDTSRRNTILAQLRDVQWIQDVRWIPPTTAIGSDELVYPGYIAIDFERSQPGDSRYDLIRLKIENVESYQTADEIQSMRPVPGG